ncbi:hypothetical protein [Thauera sp. SWB20]|uniref:hypothetical protein n=1 Tax=Thauera sp. SWB20 TaxID=1572758 RepID=UPI0005ADAE45|nr:hypothetical protein [Thauera sp. SWB20]KIN91803.1 hypothetical protein PO78_3526 [Thauera sp. SWB20]
MSTSKPFAADEESVLMAFSMEPRHGRETLERYIREYPQHATALIDCSIDLLHEPPADDAPATVVSDSAVDKAWQRFERAVQQPDAEVANPFAKLNTSSFKSLARSLDVSNLFLMRVRDRAISATTIPARFVEKLASELGSTAQAVGAYLQGPPGMVSGHAFRSSMKPSVGEQLTFDQAVATSQLTPEQQATLKALSD